MTRPRPPKTTPPLRHLPMVIALTFVCVVYVWATERSEPVHLTSPIRRDSRIERSHHLQVSRMRSRLRVMKGHPTTTSGEGCFAITEGEAREKLIQSINEAEPGYWDPTADYSSALPSAGSFMCTQGLTQDELDGISAALNTNTRLQPQLSITVNIENDPTPEAAHAIIQSYLGRERYLAHLSDCLENRKTDNHTANVQLERIVTRLLHLSTQQQEALKPLHDRLRKLHSFSGVQALDENGSLRSLDDDPPVDYTAHLEEVLSIAESGLAILTPEQRRAYREIATGEAYSDVVSQSNLTVSFLPLPEQVRETIKGDEDIGTLHLGEEAQQQQTSHHEN